MRRYLNSAGVILCVILAGCSSDNSSEINISGQVEFATQGVITFSKIVPPNRIRIIDTIELVNNRDFSFSVKVDTPDYYSLNFFDKQIINLILNESNIHVLAHGNDPFGKSKIIGSPEHDMLSEYRTLIDSLESLEAYRSINDSIRFASIRRDMQLLQRLSKKKKDWIFNFRNRELISFLKRKQLSLAHIQAFTILHDSLSNEYKRSISQELVNLYPHSPQVKSFVKSLESSNR